MTEVRILFSTTTISGPSSASGLRIDEHSCEDQCRRGQQYGLFAATDYSEGDDILTESPIVILSHLVETSTNHAQKLENSPGSSVKNVIRSQFDQSSFTSNQKSHKTDDELEHKKEKESSASVLGDLILPKKCLEKLKASSSHSIEAQTKKLRGMILAAATYAAYPPSNEDGSKDKLFELYHPTINCDADDEYNKEAQNAVELARLAIECCKELAAPHTALKDSLHHKNDEGMLGEQELLKLILIYSCNAFEGGRIYHKISRVNHSCNPNAVVVEGHSSDVSVLKAACSIKKGEEITISYLSKALYAGYPVRQRKLRAEKHFICKCKRCTENNGDEVKGQPSVSLDLASRIPCPICHPRTGRYLDEDLMFDEEEDDLQISYALAQNGMTAEERSLYCTSCQGVTSVNVDGSIRKKKEGMTIEYMTTAEDKVYDWMESNKLNEKEEDESTGQDMDRSLLQMATATCGSKHWTTQMLNLAIIEENLANLQATLMTINPEEDEKMMEEIFTDIAECADGIEKAFSYAKSLKLNLDPAHWLFDYVMGLGRILVGLGDEKSQKYGGEWITRVENYANKFEGDAMKKVVSAIKNAWKRETDEQVERGVGGIENDGQGDAKRRRVE
ncbi:hypothetical protein HJC23_008943 [Cyclotella cryptica]|uniref:SET domain-containing protein n=1 Tax=Cyclotella cryptica TaxID=29204 RepID=A0ABD3Q7E2_9STRA|eukprot:CCRYP_009635-RA/>CCRYP_009635-RA protein AED:0.38 eAED:0.38 QI:0/-1/0/1/-1/1/1/0/618